MEVAKDTTGSNYCYIAVEVTPKAADGGGKTGAVTSVDVKLTFPEASGDISFVEVSQDKLSVDNTVELKAVTSFDVTLEPITKGKLISFDTGSTFTGVEGAPTVKVADTASKDVVTVSGYTLSTDVQTGTLTLVLSHDAVSFSVEVKVKLPASGDKAAETPSAIDEPEELTEDDDAKTVIGVPVAPTLSASDAENALEEAGIDLPAGVESLTLFDMVAAEDNRSEEELAKVDEAARNALDDLLSGVEQKDDTKPLLTIVKPLSFDVDTVAYFAMKLTGAKKGDVLRWFPGDEALESDVVALAATGDLSTPGDTVFFDQSTGEVTEMVPADDAEVSVAAYCEAGTTYNPVIVTATPDTEEPTGGPTSDNGSGGCDLGLGGVVLLLAALLPLAKKR
ncbi:MAG: hypothetical protein IJ702_04890 [Fretibacterium sp.]|nr:hypothetical protein [Fretibacterium sp.]